MNKTEENGFGAELKPVLTLGTLVEEFLCSTNALYSYSCEALEDPEEAKAEAADNARSLYSQIIISGDAYNAMMAQFDALGYSLKKPTDSEVIKRPIERLFVGKGATQNRITIIEFFRKKWHVRYGFEGGRKVQRQARTAEYYHLFKTVIEPVLEKAHEAKIAIECA